MPFATFNNTQKRKYESLDLSGQSGCYAKASPGIIPTKYQTKEIKRSACAWGRKKESEAKRRAEKQAPPVKFVVRSTDSMVDRLCAVPPGRRKTLLLQD